MNQQKFLSTNAVINTTPTITKFSVNNQPQQPPQPQQHSTQPQQQSQPSDAVDWRSNTAMRATVIERLKAKLTIFPNPHPHAVRLEAAALSSAKTYRDYYKLLEQGLDHYMKQAKAHFAKQKAATASSSTTPPSSEVVQYHQELKRDYESKIKLWLAEVHNSAPDENAGIKRIEQKLMFLERLIHTPTESLSMSLSLLKTARSHLEQWRDYRLTHRKRLLSRTNDNSSRPNSQQTSTKSSSPTANNEESNKPKELSEEEIAALPIAQQLALRVTKLSDGERSVVHERLSDVMRRRQSTSSTLQHVFIPPLVHQSKSSNADVLDSNVDAHHTHNTHSHTQQGVDTRVANLWWATNASASTRSRKRRRTAQNTSNNTLTTPHHTNTHQTMTGIGTVPTWLAHQIDDLNSLNAIEAVVVSVQCNDELETSWTVRIESNIDNVPLPAINVTLSKIESQFDDNNNELCVVTRCGLDACLESVTTLSQSVRQLNRRVAERSAHDASLRATLECWRLILLPNTIH